MVVETLRSVFLQVICELKMAQLKRANTLSTNQALAEFVRLPNDELSNEIPRFASVQSNSIGSCQSVVLSNNIYSICLQ